MEFALCNEVLRELPFQRQCEIAAGLGYAGLELAPFTLSDEPHLLPQAKRREVRTIAEDQGVRIIGLHWLLVAPEGLSITSSDPARRERTVEVMRRLVELCHDLGGSVLVHGSPAQRNPANAESPEAARGNAAECLKAAGDAAGAAGLIYCLEPLSTRETPFINTIDEALNFIGEIGSAGLRTMIDTAAASDMEPLPVAETIVAKWHSGDLAHVQLNDRNRRAPGQGEDRFGPVLRALRTVGYQGPISVEPFIYEPDGPTTAALAAGYLKGLVELLDAESGENG